MNKFGLPKLFETSARGDVFQSLQREIDRVFSDFGRGYPTLKGWSQGVNSLRLNVSETEKTVEVTADVPGVEPKDINVELSDGVLTIKGEKSAEKDEKNKDYHLFERSYGSFERSVSLPAEVDADKVAAKFDKGVLTVTLPKLPGAAEKVKKIEVKAA
jgi:HSP20 family protein